MKPILLTVNVDHVATVRQARRTDEPDPVHAAVLAELGGADGITFHLREDRRHVNDRDAELLCRTVKVPVNLEMGLSDEITAIALTLKPFIVTLVPEKRQELTTEGGLDVAADEKRVSAAVSKFHGAGILVSLFVDPERAQIEASARCGADAVEMHTGCYANAARESAAAELGRVAEAARLAAGQFGLTVHAGHGLTYRNAAPIAALAEISELAIGHSIVARAVMTGMESAVRDMKHLMLRARRDP